MKTLYEDNHYGLKNGEAGYILWLDCGVEVHFTLTESVEGVGGQKEFGLFEVEEPMGYIKKGKIPDGLEDELEKIEDNSS